MPGLRDRSDGMTSVNPHGGAETYSQLGSSACLSGQIGASESRELSYSDCGLGNRPTARHLAMNALIESERVEAESTVTLELEPDILTLGRFLAKRSGLTLDGFVEYLITKEAAKGKYPGDGLPAVATFGGTVARKSDRSL